jgi:hypothetical protein
MYRRELPRLYELSDLVPRPAPPQAYFRDLDRSLAAIPQKLNLYRDIEKDLRGLDPVAWTFLKAEVAPLICGRHPTRGWQPIFDMLNQAKAYNFLNERGYGKVSFIPRSKVDSQRTPDLLGEREDSKALCEVKTINISEIEAERRSYGGVGTSVNQLPSQFFTKLAAVLTRAKAQMLAFDADPTVKRIAYVIVNYDDSLHEYGEDCDRQIEAFMKTADPEPEIETVFNVKPPFYATVA